MVVAVSHRGNSGASCWLHSANFFASMAMNTRYRLPVLRAFSNSDLRSCTSNGLWSTWWTPKSSAPFAISGVPKTVIRTTLGAQPPHCGYQRQIIRIGQSVVQDDGIDELEKGEGFTSKIEDGREAVLCLLGPSGTHTRSPCRHSVLPMRFGSGRYHSSSDTERIATSEFAVSVAFATGLTTRGTSLVRTFAPRGHRRQLWQEPGLRNIVAWSWRRGWRLRNGIEITCL